jgi:hypothetical protein
MLQSFADQPAKRVTAQNHFSSLPTVVNDAIIGARFSGCNAVTPQGS